MWRDLKSAWNMVNARQVIIITITVLPYFSDEEWSIQKLHNFPKVT